MWVAFEAGGGGGVLWTIARFDVIPNNASRHTVSLRQHPEYSVGHLIPNNDSRLHVLEAPFVVCVDILSSGGLSWLRGLWFYCEWMPRVEAVVMTLDVGPKSRTPESKADVQVPVVIVQCSDQAIDVIQIQDQL